MAYKKPLIVYRPQRAWWQSPWVVGGGSLIAVALIRRFAVRLSTGGPPIAPVQVGDRSIDPLITADLDPSEAEVFAAALPNAGKEYAPLFVQVGKEMDISPFLLAALMEVETFYGKASACKGKGSYCLGTAADDFGLMQINKSAHPDFFKKTTPDGTPYWAIPLESIRYGATVLKQNIAYFAGRGGKTIKVGPRNAAKFGVLLGSKDDPRPLTDPQLLYWAALAAYNTGAGNVVQALASGANPDATTWTGRYGKDALVAAQRIAANMGQNLFAGG